MRGGSIKNILDSFVDEHWDKLTTTALVKEWIEENFKFKISAKRLCQYLNKHESFVFEKTFNNRAHYRVGLKHDLESKFEELQKMEI